MQKEVSHLLLNYLASHDSLALAGIGRFSRHYRPAHFVGNQLKAPGSLLYFEFDRSLNASDALLSSLFKANALTEETSLVALQSVFAEVSREISQQNTFRYTGLGTFIRNGARIEFQPDAEQYQDAFGYGLESVLVQSSVTMTKQSPLKEVESVIPQKKPGISNLWLKVAAAVLLLLVANLFVLNFLEKDSAQLQQLDLVNYDSIINSAITDTSPAMNQEAEVQEEKNSAEPKQDATITTTPVETMQPPGVTTSGEFVIIVGAFREQANAEKYIDDLKKSGYSEAYAAGNTSSGLHRVAVAKFSNQEMAEAYLEEIKSKLQADAWLMN